MREKEYGIWQTYTWAEVADKVRAIAGGLAESRLHGAPYPQSWEFYVIGICLFLVAAFPGFIYRYMWRKDG